ncbi:transmembrane E3 ubiquitin-protein ligase FLY2 [Citrus sinensis]|uniref:Transmembrane E3 ubiquitin-protein ligase FLY2 n=1 Tax=Citrus sinensis TaxID=2711 RepID=A0ACB8N2R4_CITSI|nr:transmembrane E3 ubiquitin-protein ligase FLY2 [Citrus sinensis]
MVAWERLGFLLLLWRRRKLGFWVHFVFGLWFGFLVLKPVEGLRPLRERARARSWGDEWLFVRKDENELGPYSEWNITGTYRGTWKFLDSTNSSSRFRDFRKSNGNSITELVSTPTKINGVHYVQGVIIFHDVFDNEHNVGGAQIRVEEGDHDRYHIEGLMESPAVDDDGDCFSPLLLNATSVNIEVYYNKAVNYTLMVTFVSFLQGAAKVSILMIGQQAIMDAYLCLLHLTAGILVESLFNAFATAAFFKFVVFSIFEMRYLLAIWKASRPMNNGEGWETMRRELSVLYSRFYGILLGGILVMYEFHNFLRPILLLMYSFWIPQIITNVVRDSRKFLHPHYILGISVTRLAIPLYIFGCPHNFMRIEPDKNWCICLCVFIGLQASILLLQHYLGSRWFIPRQILPEKYSYYRRFDQGTYHTTDCVICMTAIDLMQRSNDCMVTPCDHFFHSGCLQRWMDIKMECPTCRRPLPPA